MRSLLVLLAAALLAGAVFFLVRDRGRSVEPATTPSAARSAADRSTAELESLVDEVDALDAVDVGEDRVALEPAPAAPTVEASPAATPPAIVGRVLLPSGAPAVGATARVHGWGGNTQRILEFGEPQAWVQPSGVTDGDGRLSLTFDPPRAYQFTLDIAAAGCAAASWRWSQLTPGETIDLGTVTLVEAGVLDVRVVDADGADVDAGWRVYADAGGAVDFRQGGGRDQTRVSGSIDPATGRAVLEGVPVGTVRLKAYCSAANWIDGPTAEVRAGETTEASIRYRGPALSSRIQVSTFCRAFHIFSNPAAGTLKLERGGREVATFRRVRGSSQSWSVDELEPGEYSIVLEDERFLPHRIDGVRPGASERIRMAGSGSLVLEVVDGNGERVESYGARLTFPESNSWPNEFMFHESSEPVPAGGLFPGVIPGQPLLVFVDAGERGVGRVEVAQLAPGESRPIRVEVGGEPVRVRVVRGRRSSAVEGVLVGLFAGDLLADEATKPYAAMALAGAMGFHMPQVLGEGQTDASGACELLDPGREACTAFATLGAEQAFVLVENKQAVLRFAGLGSVVCDIEGARAGALPAGTALMVVPKSSREDPLGSFGAGEYGPGVPCLYDEAGTFIASEVPAGAHVLAMVTRQAQIPSGRSGYTIAPQDVRQLAELEVREDETTRVSASIGLHFPGSIAVLVKRDGRPLPGVVVGASRVIEDREAAHGMATRCAAMTDAEGTATLAPLLPGTWSIHARSLEEEWAVSAPAPLVLAPGEALRTEIDVLLARATLQVLDRASGEPLRKTSVYWVTDAGESRRKHTDQDGRLTLELAAGTYVFTTDPFGGMQGLEQEQGGGVRVLWGPAGPDTERIELKAPVDPTFSGGR